MNSSETQSRFKQSSQTPPGSPKSCLKGSRKINFEESEEKEESPPHHHHHHHKKKKTPPQPKTVFISPHQETQTVGVGTSPEIPFRFHLSQHYESDLPPPNCTSNGQIEDERVKVFDSDARGNLIREGEGGVGGGKGEEIDPQLVAIATRFVNEIIEKAKMEVASQSLQKVDTKVGGASSSFPTDHHGFNFIGTHVAPWYRRAHGIFSKWVNNICVRAQNAMRT